MTRDRFFIDFSLKLVLVIYPFCVSISALLFFASVSYWDCVLYLLQSLIFLNEFYCIFILLYRIIQNSCTLSFILDMDLRRYLHWIAWMRVVYRLSYRKDCIGIQKGIILLASHVVAYPIFHSTRLHLVLLVRCALLLHY